MTLLENYLLKTYIGYLSVEGRCRSSEWLFNVNIKKENTCETYQEQVSTVLKKKTIVNAEEGVAIKKMEN